MHRCVCWECAVTSPGQAAGLSLQPQALPSPLCCAHTPPASPALLRAFKTSELNCPLWYCCRLPPDMTLPEKRAVKFHGFHVLPGQHDSMPIVGVGNQTAPIPPLRPGPLVQHAYSPSRVPMPTSQNLLGRQCWSPGRSGPVCPLDLGTHLGRSAPGSGLPGPLQRPSGHTLLRKRASPSACVHGRPAWRHRAPGCVFCHLWLCGLPPLGFNLLLARGW